MKTQNNTAFTLVELIVVITILAVLATVAFISFQGYTSSSRDAVRLADLKNISKSFEINRTKDIDFPLPDKKVDISASGTIFQYQWELSQNILESDLNIFDGGLDPVTKKPYGYAVNAARNKFQVIWFLENQESVANISQNAVFADNTDKFVKTSWNKLWIILDETTNEIIIQSGSLTEIDIQTNTQNYALIMDDFIQISENNLLKNQLSYKINFQESCKAIILSWNSKWDGKYVINPTGILWDEFEVYCDMTTDWGGWTLIAHAQWEDTTVYWYNEIRNWVVSNSQNCDTNTECLSQSGRDIPQWNDLMIYSRWYKVKGTYCNDKTLSIYDYTQLPIVANTTTNKDVSLWSCDNLSEVSQWKIVSSHSSDAANEWMIDMWVMRSWNESEEYSVLGFGPWVAPLGLWNRRSTIYRKIANVYSWDWNEEYRFLHHPWDAAGVEKQTWFIR